jgi:hypothetical protein
MRPLTWALKEVDPVDLRRQSGIHAQEIMSGIAPKQNAFKFKIAPHKQKSKKFW